MNVNGTFQWIAPLVGALVLTACGDASPGTLGAPQQPVHVRDAADAKPAVRAGSVTTQLLFDDGELRIDPPPPGKPTLDEAEAIAYLRAGSLPGSYVDVSDVVVAYGRATLTLPVDTAGTDIRPARVPAFTSRPVWLLLHENGGHGCPAMPSTTAPSPSEQPTREPLPVELIAADGSDEGVAYNTAGTLCGTPVAAKAVVATYTLSVPWTQTNPQADGTATVTATPPECGVISGYVGPGEPESTIAVGATVLLARPPCQGDRQPGSYDALNRGAPLQHAPTGLVTGMYTDGNTKQFHYYDGTDRSVP
jgi:hypothetical protein